MKCIYKPKTVNKIQVMLNYSHEKHNYDFIPKRNTPPHMQTSKK